MRWTDLKANLLAAGSARLTGEPTERYIARSTAGPGAGGSGAIFFAVDGHRVKFALNPASAIEITHKGDGIADLNYEGTIISGTLLEPGLHCPEHKYSICVSTGKTLPWAKPTGTQIHSPKSLFGSAGIS